MTNLHQSAFPVQCIYLEDQEKNSTGMTLRDYFAAKAMQSFLINLDCEPEDLPVVAKTAYAIADQMLKAREA